eukprot:gene12204-8402_t
MARCGLAVLSVCGVAVIVRGHGSMIMPPVERREVPADGGYPAVHVLVYQWYVRLLERAELLLVLAAMG